MKKLGLLGIVLILFTSCLEPLPFNPVEVDPRDSIEIYQDGAWQEIDWSSDPDDYTLFSAEGESYQEYSIYAVSNAQIYVNLYIEVNAPIGAGVSASVKKSVEKTKSYNTGSYVDVVPESKIQSSSGTLIAAIPSNAGDSAEPGNSNSNKQLINLDQGHIYRVRISSGGEGSTTLTRSNIEAILVP
jgi:hypothetical protein